MLLWGLAGFVDPVKRGKVFEQAIGFEGEDEFFKDNAIEVKIIKEVDVMLLFIISNSSRVAVP